MKNDIRLVATDIRLALIKNFVQVLRAEPSEDKAVSLMAGFIDGYLASRDEETKYEH